MYLFANARCEAALVELNKAQAFDPLSLFIAVTAVWPLRHLGQDDHKGAQHFPVVTKVTTDKP